MMGREIIFQITEIITDEGVRKKGGTGALS